MVDTDTGTGPAAERPARVPQLPRDLTDFLVELSVTMQQHAIYPPGHPLLGQSVGALYGTLTTLLRERPALSIGVARRQLIIEGVASDSAHPLLGALANKLHRHHLGAVKFNRGLTRDELSAALGTVGVEPQPEAIPLGLQPVPLEGRWANVKLFPLTYDRLELLDDDDESSAGAGGPRDGRAAQLWVGLARAAIAADRGGDPARDDAPLEPEKVARAIDEHDREPAYDQVIVGYLLQIAQEVRHDDTVTKVDEGLKRRISKLVGALQPATLKRLLEMGGDSLQRRKFVLDATAGMNVGAIIDLVKAAADAEGQTISHSLVRMLTKLATHATGEVTRRSKVADGEFREHVQRLVGSWSLGDPNPLAYTAALEQMSRGAADSAAPRDDVQFPCEPTRVIAMALELGVVGRAVTRAVNAQVSAGAFGGLLDLLDAAPPEQVSVIEHVWALVAAAEPLGLLLSAPRPDHALIQRVVVRCGSAAAPALLDALDASPNGSLRDRMFAHLSSLGKGAAPAIAAHLATTSPLIARELLATLTRISPPAPPVEARAFLTHADPALRREAARLLLLYDDTREPALAVAVRDDDERVAYAGLLAAQERCSPEIAAAIRQRVDRGELSEPVARAAAIRAVGNVPNDDTLEWLLRRTLVGGGLLRRARLAPTSPELLAALNILASRWGNDPRTAAVLARARASTSSSVRAAAEGGVGRLGGQQEGVR